MELLTMAFEAGNGHVFMIRFENNRAGWGKALKAIISYWKRKDLGFDAVDMQQMREHLRRFYEVVCHHE